MQALQTWLQHRVKLFIKHTMGKVSTIFETFEHCCYILGILKNHQQETLEKKKQDCACTATKRAAVELRWQRK